MVLRLAGAVLAGAALLGFGSAALPAQAATAHKTVKAPAWTSSIKPTGIPGTWSLKFDDEFTSTTMSHYWTPGWFGTGITGPVDSSEQACYSSTHVTQPGDGYLHLSLTANAATCGGKSRPNTGALISTGGKWQYTYGAIQWRAYLPPSGSQVANWPALWTDGQSWPADGENDTMEGLGGPACWHFHSPSGGPGNCASGNFSGWHTFASDWEPGKVTYYYDGKQVGQITSGITSAPQYLIADNTVSGSPEALPATMLLDYVHVWQH